MASPEADKPKSGTVVVTEHDILFECPACRKSLVVDESAEGVIVECPQCRISVIVPPKQQPAPPSATPAAPEPAKSEPAEPAKAEPEGKTADDVQAQLMALGNKLKELQTQRTEISNRLAARLNELNRDLVLLARLETSQQQVISDWNQLAGKFKAGAGAGDSKAASGRTRVNFGS